MLTPKEIDRFREKLTALLGRMNRTRDDVSQEALRPGGGEAGGGISNAPLHMADLGNHESEENIDLELIENQEFLIKEVSLALERIEEGTFGQCDNCEKSIAKERLRVLPYSRYCIRCAQELEDKD